MIGFTYAQLLQAMQDWPQNAGANYVDNIPRFVESGELRLIRDLNLDIFDVIDTSFTLGVGLNQVPKPAGLIQLRAMRLALVLATTAAPANTTALCAAQETYPNLTPLIMNGTLGVGPVTIAIPAQVSVTQTTGAAGGITVYVTGIDEEGIPQVDEIVSVAGASVEGEIAFSQVLQVTCEDGGQPEFIEVGLTAAAATTLGRSTPVVKRSLDFVNAYASDPAEVGVPKYYAEFNTGFWQVAPAADMAYVAYLHFVERPTSIVIAGSSWLGDKLGDVLFCASLMEAERYLKADDRFADMQADYQSKLQTARLELRNSIRDGDYSPVQPAATETQG